jgi:hypothetical protein
MGMGAENNGSRFSGLNSNLSISMVAYLVEYGMGNVVVEG